MTMKNDEACAIRRKSIWYHQFHKLLAVVISALLVVVAHCRSVSQIKTQAPPAIKRDHATGFNSQVLNGHGDEVMEIHLLQPAPPTTCQQTQIQFLVSK